MRREDDNPLTNDVDEQDMTRHMQFIVPKVRAISNVDLCLTIRGTKIMFVTLTLRERSLQARAMRERFVHAGCSEFMDP